MHLNDVVPIYTTRKTADGETFTYSISAWMGLYGFVLGGLAILVWSIIALVYAVVLSVNAIAGLF